jgi:hypothetical protein
VRLLTFSIFQQLGRGENKMTAIPAIPATKVCTTCGAEYPATLEYFPPDKQMRGGLHSWCRVCFRARKKEYEKRANPEKRRQRARKYYQKNREKLCEMQRQKRAENAEAFRKRDREYYQKNRAWLLEKERERNGSKKIDDDDYSDLVPIDERCFGFRSWAVITSSEYAAYFNRKTTRKKRRIEK